MLTPIQIVAYPETELSMNPVLNFIYVLKLEMTRHLTLEGMNLIYWHRPFERFTQFSVTIVVK